MPGQKLILRHDRPARLGFASYSRGQPIAIISFHGGSLPKRYASSPAFGADLVRANQFQFIVDVCGVTNLSGNPQATLNFRTGDERLSERKNVCKSRIAGEKRTSPK